MITGLLDFCICQGLRYTGLQLITLTDQVCKLYYINELILMAKTWFMVTESSWIRYLKLMEEYVIEHAPKSSTYWMYAWEFSPGVFSDMTFKENSYLCGMLAMLIDEIRYPVEIMRTVQEAGPTYKNLFLPRIGISKMDNSDFIIAKVIADEFKKNYLRKAKNPETQAILDAAQRLERNMRGLGGADITINLDGLEDLTID